MDSRDRAAPVQRKVLVARNRDLIAIPANALPGDEAEYSDRCAGVCVHLPHPERIAGMGWRLQSFRKHLDRAADRGVLILIDLVGPDDWEFCAGFAECRQFLEASRRR